MTPPRAIRTTRRRHHPMFDDAMFHEAAPMQSSTTPMRLAVTIAAILSHNWATCLFAQRDLTEIPEPDPVAERAAMTVAEGYEVTLFAADPMIAKPLQINFDPQGRLWVSSSKIYPHILPGEVADDTVTILEDRDGDGVADHHTVFADGLLMPTAVLPGDGGAYVANSTEMLHLSDSDGDGKADTRRVVLSGFGAEDTHHIIHTFRWGPDARLFFDQSIYIHSHVETPDGVKRLNGGGIWRFLPRTLALDIFARGWVNPWGHAFDSHGRSLVTDGAGGEGIYYGFPGAAYQAAVGTPRILHGMNPGSPKYCGLEIIDGPHLPEDARGTLVTHDFRANRVCQFRLSEAGSGFASEKLPDLIHSSRVTFRPIDVKMGPDGAIYVADWYNPIIQHGEVDFRDPRRDREHGRIWRITAKGRPLAERIDFTTLSNEQLLGQLSSSSGYARDMARRVLWSRNPVEVHEARSRWIASLEGAGNGPEVDRLQLEGLWLAQAIDRGSQDDVDRPLLEQLLTSSDARCRAAAARVAVDWADRLADPVALLAAGVDDPSMLVRLETVRALAAIGGERAAELVLHAVDHERDDALDYAVWLACRELEPAWLPAVLAGDFNDGGKPERILYAIRAAESRSAIPWVVELLTRGEQLPRERAAEAEDVVAMLGTAEQTRLAFDVAIDPATPFERAEKLLDHLLRSTATYGTIPTGDLSGLANLLGGDGRPLSVLAVKAVGDWRLDLLSPQVEATAAHTGHPDWLRAAALRALGRLSAESAAARLRSLADDPETSPDIRSMAVEALLGRQPEVAAASAVSLLGASPTESVQESIFKAFLGKRDGGMHLATAIVDAGGLPPAVITRGLATVRGAGRDTGELLPLLERLAEGAAAARTAAMTAGDVESFARLVAESGDAGRGEAIYRRQELQCVKCHRIRDEGGYVGPNLTAIGASSPLDYVIDSVLHPAKNVKEGYGTLVVLTSDGRVITGIPVSQTDTELVLRTADGTIVPIRTDAIDDESPGASLMPAGLVDGLSREELADLVRYLSELGR
jgi:putative heme-binding domain-containing protein